MTYSLTRALALAGLLAFSFPAGTLAEVYTMPDDKPLVSITIPDTWEASELDNGVEATSPDEGIYIAAEIVETADLKKATEAAIKYLIDNGVKIDAATKQERNYKLGGFDTYEVQWSGTDEDGPTEVSVAVVGVSEKQMMFVTYWGSKAAAKANLADLTAIAQSIAPAK